MPSYHAVHHKKENSGSSSDNPGESCKEVLDNYPSSSDGVYWINLPTVGVTQCYCLMDSDYDGGGWTLAMKATTTNTFKYSADYAFSQSLTGIFFFDYSFSEYAISTAFPQTTIRTGFTMRYNFGN